jgi:hypothetical protein
MRIKVLLHCGHLVPTQMLHRRLAGVAELQSELIVAKQVE